MGAAAICSAFNDYAINPSSVILEMPFGSLKEAVVGRVKMMGVPREPISSLLTFWGGIEHGFWGFSFQPAEYARKITCPVLLQWGKLDKRVTERETKDLFDNLGSSKKKFEIFPNAGHESLFKNDSIQWKKAVTDFLNNQ